jgi:Protein of unknown function (DUF3396)
MKHWYEGTLPTFTELGTTIVVGRPAFVASFYAHEGFMAHARAALDSWHAMLPANTPLYYSHETTKRFIKLTPKALAKLRDELAASNIAKQFKCYFIKSAPEDGPVDECHAFSFEIYATPSYSGYVFLTFPRDHVESHGADAVVRWFGQFCAQFEFTHAGAGFGFELAWFGEQEQFAGPFMLATGLRFHGVRVWERRNARNRARTKTTLDTAAWLTYLDATSLADIGAAAVERIAPDVQRHACGSGLLLQAGPSPDPCDTNRRDQAYARLKSVNDAIVPIRTTHWWIKRWGSEDAEKENDWFRRMDG